MLLFQLFLFLLLFLGRNQISLSVVLLDGPVVVQVEELANELVDCVPCLNLHIHGQEESQEE